MLFLLHVEREGEGAAAVLVLGVDVRLAQGGPMEAARKYVSDSASTSIGRQEARITKSGVVTKYFGTKAV